MVLVLAILMSVVACTIVVRAEATEDVAQTGADNYYLWGLNTNDPDFGAMSAPTGSFSYDGTKGYYYYDLNGVGGDYCFVVSKVNNSGATAVRTPAVGGVQNSGKYYLSQGNYRGYVCMHMWIQGSESIRIYFTSESAGLNAIPVSEAGGISNPTTAPTSNPYNPTTAPVSGYVYCKNDAGWGSVYAYMWSTGDSDRNALWPGAPMQDMGNGLWRYSVSGSYSKIIFNVGSDQTQTDDLSFPGVGKVYNNKTGQWSDISDPDPTTAPPTSSQNPTSAPPTSSQNPTSAPPTSSPGGSRVVFCKNEAGWTTVTAYMWTDGAGNNSGWPGAGMTHIGDDIWQYNVPKDFKNIIFSQNGQNQTKDLNFPGSGYIYNNKTGQWSVYDTSPLQIKSFGTDVESPQFAGTGITLSATATGQGTVYYKFSVGSTVLKDFSTRNTATWTPSAPGTYTLKYDFKDAKGNTNQRTKSFTVTDGSSNTAPFIKTMSPANGSAIKKSSACSIAVTAGGGNTGTKLLFYKYTVTDASGSIVNVPYYTRNTSYSFTPTALGKYTVTVSVQGSDNATAERTYTYNCVTNPSTQTDSVPTEGPTSSVIPTSAPTTPPGGTLIGDADGDGDVTVLDATRIQRVLADLETIINNVNADTDFDGSLTIIDATRIQRFIAGLISGFTKTS